ncbi:putative transferase CAF17 homolog, mitochondrial [Dermacentor albipictus]|uniref:putative transferase CAF17 homolog, mitochondrial n=1 Tax=Dermacentor albipictus TaxID=60249 RepID=UPI0031FDD89D
MQSFVTIATAKLPRPLANVSTSARRHLCRKSDHQRLIVCEQLAKSRKLVRLRGAENLAFLQGLVTNDTRHLSATEGVAGGKPRRCMYALMLNSVGRVLYDLIIYRPGTGEDEVLVECDADARQGLLRLLQLYRLRKPIEIGPCDDLDVWAVFHPFCGAVDEPPPASDHWPYTTKGRCVVRDPRLGLLGSRVLADAGEDLTSADPTLVPAAEGKEPSYAHLRMQLGVGEGLRELPPAACFPLECNADYMGGVSFHKGCYVGQELTARTHHTGVVRKRLMPVVMLHEPSTSLPPDAVVRDAAGAALGKLRAHRGPLGLALLRVREALAADTLQVEGVPLSVTKPGWWPRQVARPAAAVAEGQATT